MHRSSVSPPILPLYTSQSSRPPHASPSTLSASIPKITTNPDATLLALNRQTTYFQRTLQSLLDAQSTGLLAGLGKEDHDDFTPPTSRTSSISGSEGTKRLFSISRSHPRVSRKSIPRNISLQSARIGIRRTLDELSSLSTQKSSLFKSYLSAQTSLLNFLDSIIERRRGIATAITSINDDPDSGSPSILALIADESALDKEILESEEQVRFLKAKRLAVKREREQRENRLGAKLSSWKAAADELERDVRDRLLRSPLSDIGIRKDGVWALPRDRRTVELVRMETEDERKALEKKIEEVRKEREACVDGGEIWTSVVQTVESVESVLREEVGKLGATSTQRSQEGGDMRRVIALLDDAINQIQAKLELAEDRNWSLLICCIGAELEALKEGREMLDGALDLSETDLLGNNGVSVSDSSYGKLSGMSTRGMKGTGLGFSGTGGPNERASYGEDEDDEPGPELLISHQDED